MRGEVLSFDQGSGAGWISGVDGVRYSFTTADLAAPVPVNPGAVLEFTPVGAVAIRITPAASQAGPQTFGAAETPSTGLFSPVRPDFVGEPDMSIWAFAKRCFVKYADFNGRARRKEYWSFVLVEALVILPFYLALVGVFIFIAASTPEGGASNTMTPAQGSALVVGGVLLMICAVIGLARLIPSYAVLARRFHDVGLSAWWILVAFVPGASILLLVVALTPSQRGANLYGGYPKPIV